MSAALLALLVLYVGHGVALRREARRWREARADCQRMFDRAEASMARLRSRREVEHDAARATGHAGPRGQ